jgi:hypothetical protein
MSFSVGKHDQRLITNNIRLIQSPILVKDMPWDSCYQSNRTKGRLILLLGENEMTTGVCGTQGSFMKGS